MLHVMSQFSYFVEAVPIKFYSKTFETFLCLLDVNGLTTFANKNNFPIRIQLGKNLILYKNLVTVRRRKTTKFFFQEQQNTSMEISHRRNYTPLVPRFVICEAELN